MRCLSEGEVNPRQKEGAFRAAPFSFRNVPFRSAYNTASDLPFASVSVPGAWLHLQRSLFVCTSTRNRSYANMVRSHILPIVVQGLDSAARCAFLFPPPRRCAFHRGNTPLRLPSFDQQANRPRPPGRCGAYRNCRLLPPGQARRGLPAAPQEGILRPHLRARR